MYCGQRSKYIRLNSKKNSFHGNYSRKYGSQFDFKTCHFLKSDFQQRMTTAVFFTICRSRTIRSEIIQPLPFTNWCFQSRTIDFKKIRPLANYQSKLFNLKLLWSKGPSINNFDNFSWFLTPFGLGWLFRSSVILWDFVA